MKRRQLAFPAVIGAPLLALVLALALAAAAPARAGEAPADSKPQGRAQALADYFKNYYGEVATKKPELLASLKELGALFEGKEIREFAWGEKFVYEDLVRWNDLVNAELEKEGYHSYIVEQPGKGFLYLRCLLGRVEKKEAGREFQILGRKFAVDVYTLSDLLVGGERFLRFYPSFYTDRKRIYCLTDIWRRSYGGVVWADFVKWEKLGLKPAEEASLDRILPEASAANCEGQLIYRAWRAAYNRAQAAGEKAAGDFARECGDAIMRDCLPEEAVHAVQNEKAFVNHDEGLAQLVSVAMAEHPHAVLAEIYGYRKLPDGDPYRKAYDQVVPAVAGEALKLAQADPAVAAMFGKELPADAAAAGALVYRLDEKTLKAAAAQALRKMQGEGQEPAK